MIKIKFLMAFVILSAISAVLFSGIAQAGEVPAGFIGIPWGASRATVERAMAERYYPKDPRSEADEDRYNGEFAGYKADLFFRFINNKFYEGTAVFLWREPSKRRIDQYFSELESQLIKKYGNPESRYPGTNEPWEPRGSNWWLEDSNTTIQLYLHKQYQWKSRNRRDRPAEADGKVIISYTNRTLEEQEKKRAKDKDL